VSVDRQLVSRLRDDVADRLAARARSEREDGAEAMTSVAQRRYGRGIAAELLEDHARRRIDAGGDPLTPDEEDELAQAIDDALFGLGALQPLLEDVSIENVNANGCDETWITRADGTKERGPALAASDDELVALVRTAAAREGLAERRFDLGCPRLNLQLRDGSRLFAVMGVSRRPALAIRRHRYTKLTLEDLVGLGTLDAALRDFLAAATAAKLNTVISGGTSSGKTTLLRALASEIPPHERLVTIEDTLELGLDRHPELHPDVVALEVREENIEGEGAIDAAELVRMALRMDPDRVIVGEVRGSEVLPMLNAMSQGNDGSMCTIHANSSQATFGRIAAYAVQAPERLAVEHTNVLIANAVDLVVFIGQDRVPGQRIRRYVSSVREVVQAEGPMVVSNEIFRPGPDGRAVPGVPVRHETLQALEAVGFVADVLDRPGGWWER
jgi:Flp pilus assembly CpaF family ATPase